MITTPTTKETVLAQLARLQSAVVASNLDNAVQYFNLGRAIVEGAERLGMLQTHLMNDASINHHRGEKAVRWFRTLRDESGEFDRAKYEAGAQLVAQRVSDGTDRARIDKNGHPSVTAMQRAIGGRSATTRTAVWVFPEREGRNGLGENPILGYGRTPLLRKQGGDGTAVPSSNADGMARMLREMGDGDAADRLLTRPATAHDAPGHGKDARPPLVIGEQPLLPFNLIETERTLAGRVDELHDLLADERVDEADARRVHELIESAIAAAEQTISKANG